MQYILYEILEHSGSDTESPSQKIKLFKMLGSDNDVEVTSGGKTFISNFRGVTLTLNGVELFYNFIGKDHDSLIFEAPVCVNGKPCYLRFAFIFDETKFNNGHYEIIGLWDGIDSTTGMLDKGFQPLNPDDDVEAYIVEGGSAVTDDNTDETETVPKSDEGYKITEEPLKGKKYLYKFDLIDIYGEAIDDRQVNAIFKMTKSPEELKKKPLPDGEYAAEVVELW